MSIFTARSHSRCLATFVATGSAGLMLSAAASAYGAQGEDDSPFHPLEGTIDLRNGMATIDLPEGWAYLAEAEARTYVEDVWGNPPDPTVIGLAFPPTAEDEVGHGVVVSWEDDGYVPDDDAAGIDYDEMLESMQEGEDEDNRAREAAGYGSVNLIGWAERPHYDAADKKLYWAKDLLFSGNDGAHTLNYDVRILGRRGVLVMTAVAGLEQLEEVAAGSKLLLARTEFNAGHRYEDYEEGTDKLAAYGVGGLIAGKLAAKAGFFKVIALFFAKAWKLILVGIVALGAIGRRLFGWGSAAEAEGASLARTEDEVDEGEAS